MPNAPVLCAALTLCATTALGAQAVSAEGPPTPPTWDVAAESQVAFTLQRLGMLADLKLRAKKPLYLSDSEFFKDNFVTAGLSAQLSPVFAHAGAQVDLQPASFLNLSGGYHFVGYFGSLGSLRSPTDCTGLSHVAAPSCWWALLTTSRGPWAPTVSTTASDRSRCCARRSGGRGAT